ncbi:MAG: serine/threonine protein phosphatase [Pseudanabaena sp. CRU_2_10]|nr:serine/threonine protein phosphatase [Pseudanabaena sp. CRU_2_10]
MMLIDRLKLKAADQLFFLGDLIDRGPQSAQVVDWVMRSGHICLCGNHEQMCLEAFTVIDAPLAWQGWLTNGGSKTLESYGGELIPDAHLDWISQLPLYADLGDVWLVHAGVNPNLPIDKQGEMEFCWIREPFHRITEPYFNEKVIITGHTITFVFPGVQPGQLVQGIGWLDIDTGAYHPKSGWLTALELNSSTVYQVNSYTQAVRSMPLEQITVLVKPTAGRRASSRK